MLEKDAVMKAMQGRGEEKDGTPVIPLVGAYSARFADVSIREGLKDSRVQYEALKAAWERFDYDGMITWMDLTVEAQALGLERSDPEDDLPSIIEHPVDTKADLEALEVPAVEETRMEVFVDTAKLMVENHGDRLFTMAYAVGPFTLAGLLTGIDTLLLKCMREKDFARELMEFVTSFLEDYVERLTETGVDALTLLEPVGSGSLISPQVFHDFAAPYIKRLNEKIKRGEATPALHICGNAEPVLEEAEKTGTEALSFDTSVELSQAREILDIALIGNLDPAEDLAESTAEEVRELARQARREGGEKFVLSSGCDVILPTPEENLVALVDGARG